MARVYMFADEAGNFDFRIRPGASAYFILGTVVLGDDLAVGDRILELRRELAWQGIALESGFHASEDPQVVRDEVFRLLQGTEFRYDCTILEKRKTMPHLQRDRERFYKQAWFLHFKHVGPTVVTSKDELLVVAATIGEKRRHKAIRVALQDVVVQSLGNKCRWEVASWPSESDPCLQVADYCTWAVQRRWESGGGDTRSYDLIEDRIKSEFDAFKSGTMFYY